MSSATILIVEDDEAIRLSLKEILEENGYRTGLAENGLKALHWLNEAGSPPSLILLDLNMPTMDGWQFRLEQKKRSHFERIPVVVLTADGNAPLKAKNMKADGWINKPIEIELLLTVVRQFAGASS